MGLKKLANKPLSEREMAILNDLIDNSFTDISHQLAPCIVDMICGGPIESSKDLVDLKLCLSGIVNMMNQDHYNKIAKYLHHKAVGLYFLREVSSSHKKKKFHHMATNEAAVEACISRFKKNGLDETSISALNQLTTTLVDAIDNYDNDQSETTVHRLYASIFTHLFSNTGVKIAE
ncbi:hypothetical protein DFQ28_009088 [Apophysomyces sp. BC1034]|nr:hypothetical protein DFQ29_007766 [Apophysomyces sp. BC1021]KAG0185613.1 hypothetical protein DFQ28_009088 [Apophysomyces sp. BC1034]